MTSLLQRYGRSPIDVAELRGRQPADPSDMRIGSEYVPPLGGVSVIQQDRVAKDHAAQLAKRGYKPWVDANARASVHAAAASQWCRLCRHSVLAMWILAVLFVGLLLA